MTDPFLVFSEGVITGAGTLLFIVRVFRAVSFGPFYLTASVPRRGSDGDLQWNELTNGERRHFNSENWDTFLHIDPDRLRKGYAMRIGDGCPQEEALNEAIAFAEGYQHGYMTANV
ncbi:MAG: hypothetical protein KC897_11205 [Candidatus Omnitrophica bacterium]|nr:hypothetical protein [Candidatus Omnitrophota bacterium]